MDKNTLSEFGWIIVVALILLVIILFATPFGDTIFNNINAIAEHFGHSVKDFYGGGDTTRRERPSSVI